MTERAAILLVVDDDDNLRALETILTEPSYQIVPARSGQQALEAVRWRDFALVLLDLAPAGAIDRDETAAMIRQCERSRDTPLIYLTAEDGRDLPASRRDPVGAVDYLFRPLVPALLRARVAMFVELFAQRETLRRHGDLLQRAHDELEDRVGARTRELKTANDALRREIAERVRIERDRLVLLGRERAARAEAEASNRLKDEFLATLSHELRTPLNAILGWAHLLATGKADQTTAGRAVTVIRNNAQAQAQLIDDILDVSRIVGGKLRLAMGIVPLREVMEAALDSVGPAADAKKITIERQLDDVGPLAGDRDRLQQVFWNLLTNAVKFTPRDGRVIVRLERRGEDAVVSVIDTGIGIATDFLPYVFDRFTQADASVTRRHGGIGLGMAIVRHLIEQHGGTVAVESDGENRGATFTVCLPMTPPDAAAAVPAGAPAGEALILRGIAVLVVDDDPDSRAMLCALLEERGATVEAAGSAAEALDLFRRQRPNVLVSDIAMPGEDGYTLIRAVRHLAAVDGGQTPAIALTAHVREEDVGEALAAGFHRHMRKPVLVADLILGVAELATPVVSPDG